nr:zf-CCHC domain-containing protein/DUF4219 domain-containing protein/UBN2 domain-containing protein [Tanacetum cinerariifolium]
MAEENYVEGCSMQRPPLLEPNGFSFWKARFETYVKSKDTDLWQRAKLTAIKEAKYLATLPLDELVENLKVYEMILENDGVVSKLTTKEKVKSLALKDKVTRKQTSDDSDSQGESDEEKAEAFNLLAKNFRKFFRKGNWFGQGNQFGYGRNLFSKGRANSVGNIVGKSSKPRGRATIAG